MALDVTAFSGEFSAMFGAFAEQQKIFQEKFLGMVDALGKTTGAKTQEYQPQNEKQKSWLFGRPKTKAVPRTVKKEAVKVFIEDISSKVARKLTGEETPEEKAEKEVPKTKMGLLSLLGGLLGVGAVAIIGKVFGGGAGMGVAAGLLSKIGGIIFKPLKLVLKRLPIIGSLWSFWEAYEHFKAGGVDNILLGLLDVGAGFMYMLPGVGTAIGLGLDIISYFINERVEEHKLEGGDTSWLGSMYDKVIDYLKGTDTVKWMMKLGHLFKRLWDAPGKLDNWSKFFMHIGGLGTGLIDMLKNFDKKAGALFGMKDGNTLSGGLVAKLVELVNEYVVNPIVDMIKQAFKYVKDAIVAAAVKVVDTAKNIGKTALGLTPPGMAFKAGSALLNKLKGDKEKQQQELYTDLLLQKGDPKGDEQQALYDEIMKDEDRAKKFWGDLDKRKNIPALPAFPRGGLKKDFAVINGEIVDLPKSAIVSGGRVQGFSGDDTVIGFKEGEALVTGINSLIEVGENQLKALKEYLETASQNVIAPTNNSSNTYNFSVETDVSSFRKLVT